MDDVETGYALLARGEAGPAEAIARCALSMRSADPEWLQLLALSLASQGRASEASALFRELATLEPGRPAHWQNLGNACLDLGLNEDALSAFERAGRFGAAGIEFDLGYGLSLSACGRYADAMPRLQAAYAAEPNAVDTCLAYASCLCEFERYDEVPAVLAGMTRAPLSPRHRETLAWIHAQCGDDARAESLLRELLDEMPDHAGLRVHYALLLERLNRLPEARAQLDHPSVALGVTDFNAGLARARLQRRNGDHAGALRTLDVASDATADPSAWAALSFERGKVLDASGACDEAITALASAHACAEHAFAMRFRGLGAGHRLAWLDERLAAPAPDDWRAPIDDDLPQDPLFLVGFPRSGTTLLESALDSHPGLDGLDERPALEHAIALLKAQGCTAPESLSRVSMPQLHDARVAYWRKVEDYMARTPSGRLLDKYPLHLGRIPYIARLFPQSACVLLLRHPCDCVLSCYMQNFGMNGGVLSFSNLDIAARTYADIMGYWEQQRQLVVTPVHALRYEDLVGDFEGELRRLLNFVGIGWHDAVAGYRTLAANRANRIRTPSYSQVVEPLHGKAAYRWRRYRRHFSDDALALLAPFVARYGYTLD